MSRPARPQVVWAWDRFSPPAGRAPPASSNLPSADGHWLSALLIQFLQDGEGFELREVGKVEAVVGKSDLQEAVALGV